MTYTSELSERFFLHKSCNDFSLSLSWIFVIVGLYTLKWFWSMPLPPQVAHGGYTVFLTNLGYLVTWGYFYINIIYQLLKIEEIAIVRTYLSAIATSVEFVVWLVYWSLKFSSEDLILYEGQTVPPVLDALIHIMPLITLSIDYFFFQDPWDIDNKIGFAMMAVLAVAYWLLLQAILGLDAPQPYPFLDVPVPQRIVIFILVGLIGFAGFFVFKYAHPLPPAAAAAPSKKTE